MHILMVAPQPFFTPRGTPFSVLHRIRALLRLGHTVELVTYPFGETPVLPGLVVHRAARPPAIHHVPIGPSLRKLVLDVPLFFQAYRLARTRRFDLLHTHEEAGLLGKLVARRFGLRHLYDMHSSLPQQFDNFGRFNWAPVVAGFRYVENVMLRSADAVIAICPELRDHVLARGYRGPVALIENTMDVDAPPVSEEQVRALRSRLAGDATAVVVYTGTLEPYQGLELLLAAAGDVRARVADVRFVIVGGTPEQIERLRKQAAPAGTDDLFTFVPAVPPGDVFAYHRVADVLVTPRIRGTNTPLKIYQYLRAGKPIVATAIRSHTQVLDAQAAELVEPTPAGIAAGLVRVLSDRAYGNALADAARRLADERYTEAVYLQRLKDVLAALPNGRARSAA